jgi:hypothetical protein
MIDFPNSPGIGQTFTFAGQSWTWDGTKWLPAGLAGGPFVSQAGFTPASNSNRLINGDFRIDQRNAGAMIAFVNGGFAADRWLNAASAPAGKLSTRSTLVAGGTFSLGITYYMTVISNTAYTPAAAETQTIAQPVEADMIGDFAFGTPNAQPLTLSFWVNGTVGGTYSGSLCNDTGSRSYPFTFSVPAGNMQKVVINIPGCTDGTWVLNGNARAMLVRFDLGSGANFRGAAGAWQNANLTGVTGALNLCATNGAILNIAKVKLETGTVATPWVQDTLAKCQSDCERYYEAWSGNGIFLTTLNTTAGNWVANVYFRTAKRAVPTIAGVTGTPSVPNIGGIGIGGFNCNWPSGQTNLLTWAASAEI